MASMGMPKTAVNEEDGLPPGKNKIGFPRKVRVNTEAKAAGMEPLAKH
jgi:hypothetical protein